MIRAALHRGSQFLTALAAEARPPDDGPALVVLPQHLAVLFGRMAPPDRRHGLDVFHRLRAGGHTDPVLLQAALLHDVGKAEAGITVVHRAARVLLARRAGPLWRWLSGRPTGWRRPFWVVANHAERGALWMTTQGASAELVALVRYHELAAPPEWAGTPQERRHAALAEVDALS